MSFFNVSRFLNDDYERHKLENENKRLQEEIEMSRYRERRDDYDREQQHYREQERKERQRENDLEARLNLLHNANDLSDELEDLKLRRKFGVEGVEN